MTVEHTVPSLAPPLFEWFISFGNVLTILISVATLAVFIWQFAKFLRKQMKKDAEEIRDMAISKMSELDTNVSVLKDTMIDRQKMLNEKIGDVKIITQRTIDKLEQIDREGTRGVKQLAGFVQSVHESIEHVDKDVTEVKKQVQEHVNWSSEVTRKYDINDVEQRKDINYIKDDLGKLRTEHDKHVKWGEGVAEWGKDIAAKLEKSDLRQEFEMRGIFRDREEQQKKKSKENKNNNNNNNNDDDDTTTAATSTTTTTSSSSSPSPP